jgi:hypothetical protein
MIVFTHRPSHSGWTFAAQAFNLDGGGRTLQSSKTASEHAARHYLSRILGRAVLPEDARHQVEHLVRDDSLAATGFASPSARPA